MWVFSRPNPLGSSLLMNGSTSMDAEKPPPPPQLTVTTLARLGSQTKAQLKAWRHTTQRHEQIALARERSGSKVKTTKWLEDVEKKIEGISTK